VSEKLPSRKEALIFLKQVGCSKEVINHCMAVTSLAIETAKIIQDKAIQVDIALVEIGAILHDLGRSKTHTVDHAVVGANIAKQAGLPKSVISIIKRHVGGGITQNEAQKLGWKADIYMPLTLEEKIVSYADKLIENSKLVSIENTIEKLIKEKKILASKRVRDLYEEINTLTGEVF
jgi:uncharacterized protein